MESRVTINIKIYEPAIKELMAEKGYKNYTKEDVYKILNSLNIDEIYGWASAWPRVIEVLDSN